MNRATHDCVDPAVSLNEESFEDLQPLPGEFLPPPNIESTEEKESVFQMLCSMFIQIINHMSKTVQRFAQVFTEKPWCAPIIYPEVQMLR